MKYQVLDNFYPYPKDAKLCKHHLKGEILEGEELKYVLSHCKIEDLINEGLLKEIKSNADVKLPIVDSSPLEEKKNKGK